MCCWYILISAFVVECSRYQLVIMLIRPELDQKYSHRHVFIHDQDLCNLIKIKGSKMIPFCLNEIYSHRL
jgi:hypothetical protein